jgi:S-formylglutathione hydrolase FrmB
MDFPTLGRRRLLELGAGGVTAAVLAACAPVADDLQASTVEVRSGSFTSRFRPDTATNWSVAIPARGASSDQRPLPVALFLHGTGGTSSIVFDELRAHDVLARHIGRGGTPFAIAAADGGDNWWHRRAYGTDTQSMLLEEFIPMLAAQGLDTGRLGLFGLSMGGFGVLLLASQGRLPGIRAVAAMSPAVWSQYDAGRTDVFDSAEDFAANDVFALRPRLEFVPKRIDCGTEDNLLYSVRDYVKDLPGQLEGGFQAGGHNEDYWRSILPDVVSFLGTNLR